MSVGRVGDGVAQGIGSQALEESPSSSASGQLRARLAHLVDHHGGVLRHAEIAPIYVGRYWDTAEGLGDRTHNDAALAALVKDRGMTAIWQEYGVGAGTTVRAQKIIGKNPAAMDQAAIEGLLRQRIEKGQLDISNPERVFVVVLPPGCELIGSGGESSRAGLGGYHGSLQVDGREVYYAAISYGERRGGRVNGIDFTGSPRDNLSIVESHEISEAMTDPNVEAAIRENDASRLGWYDDVTPWKGPGGVRIGKGEIGDIPVLDAQLKGDARLKSAWGRSQGFAFQKEWSNRDGQSELEPKRSDSLDGS